MTDQRFTELLGKQLAGELSPEESVDFKEMLSSNESYRQEYQNLSTYFSQKEVPDQNIDIVFNKITSKISTAATPNQKPQRNLGMWLKIAAVFVVAICGFLMYKALLSTPNTSNLLTWKLLRTPAKAKQNLTLSDGTIVTLNSISELKYPASFNGNTREVYLSGEAFFDVHKDAKHPFIIHTDKIQVKVLGTAFDVKAYKNDDFTETTLIRGRVEVTLNQNNQAKFVLQPNDKFVLNNAQNQASMQQLNYFAEKNNNSIIETSWTNNKLTFKNDNFVAISRLFERWYNMKVVFENEKPKSFKFTGQFKEESITDVLNALKMIEHFNYKINGQTVYIYN